MIKISNNIFKIDYDRKKELIERSRVVIKLIEKNRTRSSYNSGLEWKISRAKSIYWIRYKEPLSIEELTILYLYVTISSDEELLNTLKRYNNDFKKVAEIYGVCPSFIKLRYTTFVFMELNKYKDLSNHKEMNEHKKMNEHKNMDEHKFLEVREEVAYKSLKLTLDL